MSSEDSPDKLDRIIEQALSDREKREKSYREKALKMYPWVCGRCGREFNLKNLRELTVHHRDHNHNNNPSDGSNWELLCIYCHDNEHSRYIDSEYTGTSSADTQKSIATHKAFADLADLLKKK